MTISTPDFISQFLQSLAEKEETLPLAYRQNNLILLERSGKAEQNLGSHLLYTTKKKSPFSKAHINNINNINNIADIIKEGIKDEAIEINKVNIGNIENNLENEIGNSAEKKIDNNIEKNIESNIESENNIFYNHLEASTTNSIDIKNNSTGTARVAAQLMPCVDFNNFSLNSSAGSNADSTPCSSTQEAMLKEQLNINIIDNIDNIKNIAEEDYDRSNSFININNAINPDLTVSKRSLASNNIVAAGIKTNVITNLTNLTGDEIWKKVSTRLRKFYGENVFVNWFQSFHFLKVERGQIIFTAPTGFIKEWIITNYANKILEYWQLEGTENISTIEIQINSVTPDQAQAPSFNILQEKASATGFEKKISCNNNLSNNLSAPLDKRRTFATFVVGKSNELAFAAAKRLAGCEVPINGSNPLFLYGGVGLGKTHLMHSIAWHIREHYKHRKVIYLSAEKFMYKYITALKNKEIMSFKQLFRSVDVLMIDDVQFISGKDSTQEEFFHTFNTLIDQNKQLVISADRSPSDLQGIEERIRSRLSWGLVTDINNTTFELRVGILQAKLQQMKVNISLKIIEFIARNIISNVRELEGALNKVIANSVLIGAPITLDSTKGILADLLRTNAQIINMDDILMKISEHFNIKISDLRSLRRLKDITYARQLAMYLAKTLTQFSLLEIGKFFGRREHATVIHSIKKIESLIKHDAQAIEDINILTKKLNLSKALY